MPTLQGKCEKSINIRMSFIPHIKVYLWFQRKLEIGTLCGLYFWLTCLLKGMLLGFPLPCFCLFAWLGFVVVFGGLVCLLWGFCGVVVLFLGLLGVF